MYALHTHRKYLPSAFRSLNYCLRDTRVDTSPKPLDQVRFDVLTFFAHYGEHLVWPQFFPRPRREEHVLHLFPLGLKKGARQEAYVALRAEALLL